jgi:hypothetical protein
MPKPLTICSEYGARALYSDGDKGGLMASCFTPQATISAKQLIIPSWNEKGSMSLPVVFTVIFANSFDVIWWLSVPGAPPSAYSFDKKVVNLFVKNAFHNVAYIK